MRVARCLGAKNIGCCRQITWQVSETARTGAIGCGWNTAGCDCALSMPRLRTLKAASAHSQGCECAVMNDVVWCPAVVSVGPAVSHA